ncbi:MAG: hypothetical protein F6K47_27280 [Symploca sp. SIO2E6]|nr:hypothetical protein [Symploca sp. SIO2E6]
MTNNQDQRPKGSKWHRVVAVALLILIEMPQGLTAWIELIERSKVSLRSRQVTTEQKQDIR